MITSKPQLIKSVHTRMLPVSLPPSLSSISLSLFCTRTYCHRHALCLAFSLFPFVSLRHTQTRLIEDRHTHSHTHKHDTRKDTAGTYLTHTHTHTQTNIHADIHTYIERDEGREREREREREGQIQEQLNSNT